MLALYSRCTRVLTGQTRHCCAYSITLSQLLLSVDPKDALSIRIKCICSNACGDEQSYCGARQYLSASDRLIRLFWKVSSHMHIRCVDGGVGKCVCRCSDRCVHTLLPKNAGLAVCLLLRYVRVHFCKKRSWTAVATKIF